MILNQAHTKRLGIGTILEQSDANREYAKLLEILYPHGLLSRLEIHAIAELMEKTELTPETSGRLPDLLDAACEHNQLHDRWDIDREGLVSKLRGTSPVENWAIYERVRRWQREKRDEVWTFLDFPKKTP